MWKEGFFMNNESVVFVADALNMFWLFFGAVLVFFMQAGFTLVEAGFTRAKNTGNIIMKNCVDYLFGSIAYWIFGYSLMYGDSIGGFIGIPFSNIMTTAEGTADYATLFFQTVFCATCATIVSGAMAERTKFSAYVTYSVLISLFIYPIAGHWVWGGGWLSQLGFHDFAGSALVHMQGGTIACVGAMMLGPRIGKYGKNGKVHAFPGHNILMGATGVFILWFGWFGFNPASTLSLVTVENGNILDYAGAALASKVFVTTNIASCAAGLSTLFFTWIRYKKPDVSMTLNGILAGLVGITAPCDVVNPVGALIIGIVAGIIVVLVVEVMDKVFKIDDPVGAVAVHGCCGAWGTIAVGLFGATEDYTGLFYGGGFHVLGVQLLGMVTLIVWAAILAFIIFSIMRVTFGLRASEREELEGLDPTEHGLESAYAGFMMEKDV